MNFVSKVFLLLIFLLATVVEGFSTVYYACGTGITWNSSFLYTTSDCSGGGPVNPSTLTSADEMVIQAGAVVTVEGSVTLNAIKLTVYGTLFIHTPAIAGKLTMPDNAATIVFEVGSTVGCTDDGISGSSCSPASSSQIIVGNGGNKYTYKGSDIDDVDDLPKPSLLDNEGGSLPISLIFFDGESTGNTILLDWATSSEENFDFFEIERASNGLDYFVIGKVGSKGGVDQITAYDFYDENPLKNINYYRLKSIDYDGSFEYHPVISVDYNGEFSRKLLVYPNPATDEFTLRPNFAFEKARISLKDLNGKLIFSEMQEYPSKIFNIPPSVGSGMYVIEFQSSEGSHLEKLILNR